MAFIGSASISSGGIVSGCQSIGRPDPWCGSHCPWRLMTTETVLSAHSAGSSVSQTRM